MKDQEQLALGFHDHALAEPVKICDRSTFDGRERRIDRAQEKGTSQSHAGHALADDPRSKRVQVQEDVGELRHNDNRIG